MGLAAGERRRLGCEGFATFQAHLADAALVQEGAV
jgi:hypothetical protein